MTSHAMTVPVEQYRHETNSGLAQPATPLRHFVLPADQDTLRRRIPGDTALDPDSPFRLQHLEHYAEVA